MFMFARSKLNLAVMAAIAGGVGFFPSANAQETDRMEITGSRLKRVDAEAAAPVQIITRADIESTGKLTLSEVLQALPMNNNGSVPTSFGNGFAAGGSGISLRGLSVNSTLVLLNGRRMAPYGLADDGQRNFVDLSSIPLDLVDRVEILKDGASAVYGSDAIAGVVNIILRKDFKGFIGSASAGTSRYGDANSTRASLTKGFGDLASDNYNAFINLEVSHQSPLTMSDRAGKRDFIGLPNPYNDNSFTMVRGYAANATPTSVSASPTGWARAVTGPNSVTPVTGSKYIQLGKGCVPNPGSQTLSYNANPACLWNINDYQMIQPKEDKVNLFARGTYNLSADTQIYGEAGVFNSKVSTTYTPTSVSGIWANPSTNKVMDNTYITMGPNHPDNPTPGSYSRLRYVTADLGGRNSNYDTTVARVLGGIKGTMAGWDYDSGFLYTQSETKIERNGYVVNSALQALLNGTSYNGVNYGYYRLGTNAGLNSAALRAAISPTLNNATKNSVTSLDFKASKELMALPGGAMQVAMGAEVRQEKLSSPPTPYTSTGDIVGLGYSTFNQSRSVTAAYAELVAPVTKSLELNAAVRNDSYSDWGNAITPKVGAKWKAADAVVFRGSYAEGFRAPGAGESGKSQVSAYTNVTDPVRCPKGAVLPGGLATDCAAQQVVAFSSGNPNIQPEKSKSWNWGVVLEPTKSLNMSIDFWRIERTNEILGVDPQLVLNNPTGYASAQVVRDLNNGIPGVANSGSILAVLAPYANGQSTKTNGVDIDLRYRFPTLDNGLKLSGGLNISHINAFDRVNADGTVSRYAGTYGPTALSSSAGMPSDRAVMDLTVQGGNWSATGRINYTGPIKQLESLDDATCLQAYSNGQSFYPNCTVPSFMTFDVFGRYQYSKNLEFNASIQNLFDKLPSFDHVASYGITGYNPSYSMAGVIGRYFRAGVKYKFD
jgi:iron complex outermembrane receptor protein